MSRVKRMLRLLIPVPLWMRRESPHDHQQEEIVREIDDTIKSGDKKVEQAIATINGDMEWFLCLSNKDKEDCKSGPNSG